MKAIAIEAFGGAAGLRKRGLPRPEPADGELRVRVVAAGVTALDAAARRGAAGTRTFPWVPGFEIAGTVDALGAGCVRHRLGDKVMAALPQGGGYAEFVAVDERRVAAVPPALLFEEAAALPLEGAAAWLGLFGGEAPLDETGTAIVLGAASGPGHLAVQLALACGARVIAAAEPAERAFVSGLGKVEWAAAGSSAADLAAGAVAPVRCVDARGDGLLRAALGDDPRPDVPAALAAVVGRRCLRPRLFKIFNVAEASEAHRWLETGGVCGTLALTF